MNTKRIIVILLVTLFLYSGLNYLVSSETQSKSLKNVITKIQKIIFKNEEYPLVVPKLDSDVLSSSKFPDHFKTENGEFILMKETVFSKQAPNVQSKDYLQLYQTQRVRVIFEKSQKDTVDGSEKKWVFVSNEKGTKYYGWLFKDQLIFTFF